MGRECRLVAVSKSFNTPAQRHGTLSVLFTAFATAEMPRGAQD